MSEIRRRLIEILREEGSFLDNVKNMDINAKFSQLGMDSLDIISFISSVESEYGINIKDDELVNITTFEELEQVILSRNE